MVVLHMVNWPVLLSLPPTAFGWDTRTLVAAAVCTLAFPTLLVQTRHLAAFAAVGLAATTMVSIVSVAAPLLADMPLEDGAECPRLDRSNREGDVMSHSVVNFGGFGVATGLALFAFAGHATFPELWRQMSAEERPNFGLACDVGFGLAAAFYCALASLGYYFFGGCASDSLTLNLMSASPALGGVATLGVLLSTFTSISVLSVPVVRIIREATVCGDKQAKKALRFSERVGVGLLQPFDGVSLAIKICMMVAAALIALSVPNFGFIVALMGAFTCMLISFILPVLCNIAVHREDLSTLGIVLNVCIVLVGLVGMVVGVQSTLAEQADA